MKKIEEFNWRKFLKPDWRKLSVFIIFVIFSSLIEEGNPFFTFISPTSYCNSYGFPFLFYTHCYREYKSIIIRDTVQPYFMPLILNLIIWYLVSSLIFCFYDKFRGRKK